ncbi:hypothetical protein HZA33_05015 [Candidatus Pacearchaeota archaeon]|nr:hypothetical protein [Candidatus Pacearchaeota archaeon]
MKKERKIILISICIWIAYLIINTILGFFYQNYGGPNLASVMFIFRLVGQIILFGLLSYIILKIIFSSKFNYSVKGLFIGLFIGLLPIILFFISSPFNPASIKSFLKIILATYPNPFRGGIFSIVASGFFSMIILIILSLPKYLLSILKVVPYIFLVYRFLLYIYTIIFYSLVGLLVGFLIGLVKRRKNKPVLPHI